MQIAGFHADQRRIDCRHARWHCCQRRRHARGGVVVSGQVVAHDGRIVDASDAQQYGSGPARTVLACGAMKKRGTFDTGQLIEKFAELTAHSCIPDEIAVGVLHQGEGLSGAGVRDGCDVRTRRGIADDVDVAVGGPGGQGVGRGGDLAGRAQVIDSLDPQGVQGGQIRPPRCQRIGAVEHTGTHCSIVSRGIRGSGASDIPEVIQAPQARSVEGVGLGGLGGGDGQGQSGQ
ncbi:hypothetical protein D3C76_1006340 [compost metagenome]